MSVFDRHDELPDVPTPANRDLIAIRRLIAHCSEKSAQLTLAGLGIA
jgi:hypothetical protein